MDLSERCNYSYYVPVAPINEEHEVWLVQHAETGKFYVRKSTRYYNLAVFQFLKENPIPNMPRIFELFEDDGTLHIIEEYISGTTLEELVLTQGPFSVTITAEWTHQLCEILKGLHSCTPPIIHRDIKPSNIILTYDGKIKLLDLSAARQSNYDKSQDTVIMGTAGYAAPEQYGFSSSSESTDIYSVGILMNKLLTGKLLSEQVYTGELSKVISKCTQLDPSKRYERIELLDKDLYQYLDNPPIKRISIRDYLPPGFRSGNIVIMLLALLGYCLVLTVALTMTTTKDTTPRILWATRISATSGLLSMIFFSGNYLGCQTYLPLSRSKNLILRIIGVIIWDVVIFCICVLIGATFT